MHIYNFKQKIRRLRSGVIALLFLATYGIASVAPFVPASPAWATTESQTLSVHKSYVCKYVGTPGVDERLQTGQNPIWVDNHSLLGKDGTTYVGEQFSDKQGKSVVIVANTAKLDPEPGVDQCPAPQGPAKDATASFTLVPATCTADGSVNFTDTFATLTSGGEKTPGAHTATFTSLTGHLFGNGTDTLTLSYTVAAKLSADSEECYVPPTHVTATAPTVDPVCGPNNDTVDVPSKKGVIYTDTGWVNGSRTITATAKDGYVLEGTYSWTFTDQNVSCPAPHKSYVCKYVGTPGVDERLQTGQNPIWVDNNSLLGNDGTTYVGEQFSDAQGKSIVIVANTDRITPEPTVADCPAPHPAKDATASFTLVPATCVTDGSVTFAETHATLTSGGETTPGAHTVTFTADSGHVFSSGLATLTLSYTVATKLSADSEECYVPLTPVKPADPTVTPVCGPNNDIVNIPATEGVTYSSTGWVDGKLTVTATAKDGYVLDDDTSSWTFTDANVSCGHVLGDSTTTPNVLAASTTAPQLENTGNSFILPMLLSTGVLGLAIMTILQSNTRKTKFAFFVERMVHRFTQAFTQPFMIPVA